MKEILRAAAIDAVLEGKPVYRLTQLTEATTLAELGEVDNFIVLEEVDEQEAQNEATEALKAEAQPKKAESKQPARRIDHGKIIALHKAGWTTSAIAFEIGCSQQTVINHINAEKEGQK